MIAYLGLCILIAQTFNMWALLSVLAAKPNWSTRAIWVLVLTALPGIGFLAWLWAGPKSATT